MNSKSWGLEKTENIQLAAQNGDPYAQTDLGLRYKFGHGGLPEDHTEAVRWLRRAAEQGYVEAQACLAGMYEKGQGVSQDYAEAVKWSRKAAEQGSVYSQHLLADCFLEGRGVARDREEANRWYRKVIDWTKAEADKGEPFAQARLAEFYLEGHGVAQDSSTAIQWYCKSADKRCDAAKEALEDIYLRGKWPIEELAAAVQWFQSAADEGRPKAQYILGLMNKLGQGVPQNNLGALKWFQRAADHKHPTQWFQNPADGEPVLPEAQKAVEDTRKLLTDSESKVGQIVMGGLDDLCAAVERHDIRKIRALIQGGACVNAPKEHFYTLKRCPFLIAATEPFSPREVGGIRQGYKPDRHDYWELGSFQSESSVNKQILDVLINNGAEVFPLRNVGKQSSIHAAAGADNTNALRMILELHPDAGNYNADDHSPTPLEVAASKGCFQAVTTLLSSKGTQWRITSPFQLALDGGWTRTAKELVAYIPEGVSFLDKNLKALFEMLLWSAVDNQTQSFEKLVKYVGVLKNMGGTVFSDRSKWDLWNEKEKVLNECFGYACRYASLDMVKIVFNETESLDINKGKRWGYRGIDGPPLIYAAQSGNFELAEFCIRVGADPFVHNSGLTPIDIAKQNGYTKLVVLLQQAMKGDYMGRVKSIFRKFTG